MSCTPIATTTRRVKIATSKERTTTSSVCSLTTPCCRRSLIFISGYPVGMKRFRSPNELKPHALWLCDGMPRDSDGKSTCGCEYCTGKKVKSSQQQHQRASSDPHEQRQLAAQKAQKLVAGSGRSQPGSLAPPVQARNEGTGPDWAHLGQTVHIEAGEEREEDELPDEML
jgi:hypothetical protein